MNSSPRTRHRRLGIIGAVAAGAAALVLAVAGPASAHVRVDGNPTAGGYAVLTFRVPTESATASTTAVTVTFPKDTPLSSVSTQPKPGWTAKVTTADLPTPQTNKDGKTITSYVSSVTWTATGDGIKPGEFDTFAVSAGPIPNVASLVLPAAQTYSDGSVVNWDQIAQGTTEPEHPAPTVTVAAAAMSDMHGASSAAPEASGAAGASASPTGDGLGLAGLVAGGLALILAIIALLRGNRARVTTDK